MKRILIPRTATLVVILILILAACAAPAPTGQPTSAPPQPSQTPVVLIETVVVTVIPTNLPAEVPSATLPPPTEAPAVQPPTEVVEAAAPTAAPADASGGLVTLEDKLGAGWFVGLTRTRSDFSLRCQLNKEITFSVKPTDAKITQVDFFYRIEDRATGAVFDWVNTGRMIPDANGNYVKVLTGEDVHPNFRKPLAWFDYQFVGSNGSGVMGRSEKIEKQVTYTFDCP